MIKPLLFGLSLSLTVTAAHAQTSPSINMSDMPAVGDSLRLSQAAVVLPASAPALTVNGANKTWNYAGLVATSQRVERYATVTSSATGTQLLTFGLPIGANRANLASPRDLGVAGGVLPVSDPHEFFLSSSADFRSVGFGVTFGGIALPITYLSQARQDVIYHLPQAYGTAADASDSFFEIAVPGTGALSRRRKRSNLRDAWGTLTTPFGTFQTLRIVTTIIDRDSVVFGTTAIPATTLPTQREYKWLAKGVHVPILTITTTEIAGVQQITGVEYRDIYRRFVPLAGRDAATNAVLSAAPNPSAVGEAVRLSVPAGSCPLTVAATDMLGRQVFSRQFGAAAGTTLTLEAAAFGNFRGMLLLTVTTAQGTATRRVVRE
jgi:hypothetical protein